MTEKWNLWPFWDQLQSYKTTYYLLNKDDPLVEAICQRKIFYKMLVLTGKNLFSNDSCVELTT